MSPCGGRRAEWESIANTAEPGRVAILKWHKTCLPTCPKSCTESSLASLCLHTKADALLLSPMPTMETVLARKGLQQEQMLGAATEFGICQECTCLHYLLTVECHRARAGERERRGEHGDFSCPIRKPLVFMLSCCCCCC